MLKKRKILIIQTAFLGDCILTLPLINTVKKCLSAHVSVLVTPAFKDVFKNSPSVDKVIVYDKKGADRGPANFLNLVKIIKNEKFEQAFLPQRSFRSGLIAFLSGIPKRIAFKRGGAKFLATERCEYDWDKHEVERLLNLARLAGCKKPVKEFSLIPDNNLIRKYKDLFSNHSTKKVLGICVQSEWKTKQWPVERYKNLIKEVWKDFTIVIIGKNHEKWDEDVINLTGKTSVKELLAAVSCLDILLSNDTGVMHIGAAFKKPVIAIFGPTVPGMGFSPYGNMHKIIEVPLNCRPCSLHGPQRCPLKHFKCMRDIEIKRIKKDLYDKVKELKTDGK